MAETADLGGRNAYVGCLDVLGFRDIYSRNAEALVEAYKHFVALSRLAGALSFTLTIGDGGPDSVRREIGYRKMRPPMVFSDTVLLVTEDDSEESLAELCVYANTIFRQAFASNIPMRGALAHGRTWYDPKAGIALGESFIRAHGLEQSLEVLGIVLDESLPPTRAASLPLPLETKAGRRRLRAPLRRMRGKHPEHLPQDMPLTNWGKRLRALQRVAPEAQRPKYENSFGILEAIFEAGPE